MTDDRSNQTGPEIVFHEVELDGTLDSNSDDELSDGDRTDKAQPWGSRSHDESAYPVAVSVRRFRVPAASSPAVITLPNHRSRNKRLILGIGLILFVQVLFVSTEIWLFLQQLKLHQIGGFADQDLDLFKPLELFSAYNTTHENVALSKPSHQVRQLADDVDTTRVGAKQPTTRELDNRKIAYAQNAGSIFWLFGSITSEYPYSCKCSPPELERWHAGDYEGLITDEGKSEVPCEADTSTALFGVGAPRCDPTFQ